MTDAIEPKNVKEPTMEEILTSIRQVISDDEVTTAKGSNNSRDQTFKEEGEVASEDILELTEIVADDVDATTFSGKLYKEEVEQEPASPASNSVPSAKAFGGPRLPPKVLAKRRAEEKVQTLLSDHTVELAADKLSGLTGAVAAVRDIPLGHSQQTIEELVKDVLRPMLKEWLDDNLPPLVERLVEKEIAKLVSRAKD